MTGGAEKAWLIGKNLNQAWKRCIWHTLFIIFDLGPLCKPHNAAPRFPSQGSYMTMINLNLAEKIGGFLLIAAFNTPFANAATKNLCTPDEQVFFSCEMQKKIVSLCAVDNADSRYMEYRFGQPGKIELRYSGGTGQNAAFTRTEVVGANNASDVIWFENQGVHYVLNFPMRGAPALEVIKSGKSLAHMACKNGWGSSSGEPAARSPFIVNKPTRSYFDLRESWER